MDPQHTAIWNRNYGHTSDYLIQRLQRIQNKLVKVLFGKTKIKKTIELFTENELLNLKELKEFIILTKYYYCNKHKIISRNINRIRDGKRKFEMPKWNNLYGKRRKTWFIPEIFNKIPNELLNYGNIAEFKRIYRNSNKKNKCTKSRLSKKKGCYILYVSLVKMYYELCNFRISLLVIYRYVVLCYYGIC